MSTSPHFDTLEKALYEGGRAPDNYREKERSSQERDERVDDATVRFKTEFPPLAQRHTNAGVQQQLSPSGSLPPEGTGMGMGMGAGLGEGSSSCFGSPSSKRRSDNGTINFAPSSPAESKFGPSSPVYAESAPRAPWPTVDFPVDPRQEGIHTTALTNYDPTDLVFSNSGSIMLSFDPNYVHLPPRLPPDEQEAFDARVKFFKDLQQHRVEGKKVSAFTMMIMEKARLEEEARLRALADKDRERRAKEFFLRHLMAGFHDVFFSWKDYVYKVKKAKRFMLKHMMGAGQKALFAWREYVVKNAKARRFLEKHMGGVKGHCFRTWKQMRETNLKIKRLFARHLAGELKVNFMAWAKYVERLLYVKQKFASHLAGLERKVFLSWRQLVYQQVRAKKMLLKHMMGGLRMVYTEWARYVSNTIKARRLLSKHMLGFEKAVLRAWHVTAQQERKDRLAALLQSQPFAPQDFFVSEELMVGIYPTTVEPPKEDYSRPSLKDLCAEIEDEALTDDAARVAEAQRIKEAEDFARTQSHTHNASETDADATPWL